MYRYQWRRDTNARWTAVNPVLLAGEPGLDEDTGVFKIGDGTRPWSELEGFYPGAPAAPPPPGDAVITDEQIIAHVNDPTPHPVYDDGPSLLLLYQNAKV